MHVLKDCSFFDIFFLIWKMPKNMTKTIHENSKFLLWFFQKSFKNHLIPMMKKYDFKKLDITLSYECFPKSCFDIVTTAFFENFNGKISMDKNLLNGKLS